MKNFSYVYILAGEEVRSSWQLLGFVKGRSCLFFLKIKHDGFENDVQNSSMP